MGSLKKPPVHLTWSVSATTITDLNLGIAYFATLAMLCALLRLNFKARSIAEALTMAKLTDFKTRALNPGKGKAALVQVTESR